MPDPAPLDAAADRLARRLLAAHPPERAYGRDALAALPPPVARVLAMGLDHTADALARGSLMDTPWLDAAHPVLHAAAETWAAAVPQAVHYPAEAWADAIHAAAHVALRLLVAPADGLAAVAFDGADGARPAPEVLARVAAASPYAYLPDVAVRYAERKAIAMLDRAELEQLLGRIERRMADTLSTDDWLALAEPLYELAGPDGVPAGTLPAALVRAFLEARGQHAPPAALPATAVSRAGLRAHLASGALTPLPEPAPAPPDAPAPAPPPTAADAPDEPAASDAVPADEALPASAVEIHPILDPPVSPLASGWDAPDAPPDALEEADAKEAGAEETDAEEADREAPLPEQPVAPTPEPETAADEPLWRRLARRHEAATPPPSAADEGPPPLWQRFAPGAAPDEVASAQPSTTGAMRLDAVVPAARPMDPDSVEARVLGPGAARAGFVRDLFGGDASAYHQALAALDAATSWTETTDVLAREVFRREGVLLYSDAAVAFTDAVESAFARRA